MADYSSMKTRRVWLTEADWRGFADRLSETFPTVSYFNEVSSPRIWQPEPPDLAPYDHLFKTPNFVPGGNVIGVFDRDWRPEYRWQPFTEGSQNMAWTPVRRIKNPAFLVQMMRPLWTAEVLRTAAFMEYSVITFYRDPGNHEHDLLSRHFYRLLGKHCTNRNQVQINMPDRTPLSHQPKGSLYWLGHDAIRWANENPQRVFFYNSRRWALRPAAPAKAAKAKRSIVRKSVTGSRMSCDSGKRN